MASTNAFGSFKTLVKKLEENDNAKLKAYLDSGGVWTIGWGSIWNYDKNRAVKQGDTITQEQADRYLEIEAAQKYAAVKSLVKVPLTNNELIALCSLVYNIGVNAFAKSTLLKQLNAGVDRVTVAQQFDRWVYDNGIIVKGLQNRRAKEKKIFLS